MKKSRLISFGIITATIIAIILTFYGSIRDNMKLGLDLQGGFEILYEVEPLEGKTLPSISAVTQSIQKRIDVLGVNEPEISVEGENRIRVQLAGVKDADQARRVISSTANLTFRDVNDNLLMDATVLKEGQAQVSNDEYGRAVVTLNLQDSAKFYEVTQKVSKMGTGKNLMVAWLDFKEGVDSYAAESKKEKPSYISAATVSEGINSQSATISGNFTREEAQELANLINSGSLPVKMNEVYTNAVSAEYGIDAFSKTMMAGAIGIIAIMIFMIIYYRLPGLISAITISTYVFVVFLIYNAMGGVFTLSGIAALVLGVGMAVDSNIITFERIKDSMYSGRSVRTAFYEGSSRSFRTILDSQLTTFISAFILYIFGTGSVKGFATMLIVSIITTLLLIVFVARFLLKLIIDSGYVDKKRHLFAVKEEHVPNISKGEEQFYFGKFQKFDFVGKAKYFIIASISILVLSCVAMGVHAVQGNGALNLGIDFTSGTKMTIQSDTAIDKDTLSKELSELGIEASSIQINGEGNAIANVFIKQSLTEETLKNAKESLKNTYGHEISENTVTPVVGQELIRNAVLISVLAWVGVLIYISIRFKWDYAISGIVALIHDVLIILAFCAIFRLEINTEIIAVLLAIIGYSINNSIVVFDRIRELVRQHRHENFDADKYKLIVNEALQKTLMRSVLSTFTTILPVICLLLLGSNAIFTFNLALFIGLAAGAGSSVFIAAQLWLYIRIHRKDKPKKKKIRKLDEIQETIIPGMNDF
ncbi:MAG: protein translocase subunit SecD [Erysipelotrichaceae bacterium]|nr:protein translocase subunit SecD [Erysipelotrichaceae bacterium]